MNAMTKIVAAVVMTGATSFVSTSANGWWDNDSRYDRYDRWHGGPWYGGHPGWGGYRGWGGYPGSGWANYPGYNRGSTIIVNPRNSAGASESVPVPRLYVPE
ncbi:MAG: hypothetical protein WBM52_10805 [Thiogranum sp.]